MSIVRPVAGRRLAKGTGSTAPHQRSVLVQNRKPIPNSRFASLQKDTNLLKDNAYQILSNSKSMMTIGSKVQNSNSLYFLQNSNSKIVQLRIFSNWGESNFTTIATVVLLDDKKRKIPVLDTLIGHSEIMKGQYLNLYNEILDSDDPESIFTITWPPINSSYSLISILISDTANFGGIRIWNSSLNPKSGIKNYEIYVGEEFLLKGEVPYKFGGDLFIKPKNFVQNTSSFAILKNLFPETYADAPINDIYGRYPLFETKIFKFKITSTWAKEPLFGLNRIRIYDQKGHSVTFEEIQEVEFLNCINCQGIDHLFQPLKETNKKEDMFFGETDWECPPEIKITFKRPLRIIMIDFYNYNANNPSIRNGVKTIKLYDEKRCFWSGILKQAGGKETDIDAFVTAQMFCDLPDYVDGINDMIKANEKHTSDSILFRQTKSLDDVDFMNSTALKYIGLS